MFPYKHNFVLNPEIIDESHIHYDLDINIERWPWLCLPADHPALIGKHSFFVGIGCGLDLLKLSPDSASALTEVRWQNLPPCFEHTHTVAANAEAAMEEDKFRYGCELLSPDADIMQTMQARGVVFQHRDYGSWRDRIKRAIERTRPQDFNFAAPETAGVATPAACFVSPLHEGRSGLSCYALVDADRGFVPDHPWHTGTGDHVNASQQLDVAMQAAHLAGNAQGWWGSGQTLECLSGEASFKKYIELNAPIEVKLIRWKPLEGAYALRFKLIQNTKACAEIVLSLCKNQSGDLPAPV